MSRTPEQIAATIAALEAQRAILGDEVLATALAPLRLELAALQGAPGRDATAPPQLHRQPQSQPQQLKQVSVLFVDVVGSTAMG